MKSSQFLIPQNQFLSSGFLVSSKTKGLRQPGGQKRHLSLLARYALYQGLRAFGIGQGDEVLVPAYLCMAAVKAVEACGAVPVFFQVRRDCSLDLEDAEKRISPRTKALLVVHYFGFPQDLRHAQSLAAQKRLVLIEDCAHVLEGQGAGKSLGSTGDFSVFSWRKFLPILDGAELVLNTESPAPPAELRDGTWMLNLKALKHVVDERLASKNGLLARTILQLPASAVRLARTAFSRSQSRQDQPALAMDTNTSGFDLRLADAAISGVSKFTLLHSDIAAIAAMRRQNYHGLEQRLTKIPGARLLFPSLPVNNCPLYLPLFLGDSPGAHRQLRQLGIPAAAWDGVRPPAVVDNRFPDAGFLYQNLVFLPLHQNLRDRDLDLIADMVNTVCKQRTHAAGDKVEDMELHSQAPDTKVPLAAAQQVKAQAGSPREEAACERKALLVAFHFPPHMGSSGHLRSLKYSQYLPEHGWAPTVLTVHPRAYEQVDKSKTWNAGLQGKVIRAFGLDARKHLSLRGRYLGATALPDRWVSWCVGAVPAGILEIYRRKIDVIMTTFPIASAVLVGYLLHKITRVPWIADFRDPMTEHDYPRDARTRRMVRRLEEKAVRHASRLIFTTRSTMQKYLQRYPELPAAKCLVISNGYDEQDFVDLPQVVRQPQDERVRMHHSGLIYPEERNPVPFFNALSRLKKENRISSAWFSVDLRACGNDARYREIVVQLGIEDVVHFLPALPYREALLDSNQADILLLFQGASCDHQIPAKTYEYLRLRKPILALTTPAGDTAELLRECGGATIIDMENEDAIYRSLPDVLAAVQCGTHPRPKIEILSKYSRQSQSKELARCFSAVADNIAGANLKSLKRSGAGS